MTDADFSGSIAEFEGLAQNQHIDVGSNIRFVAVTVASEIESISSEER
jgi:hypothetical protein